MKSSQQHTRIVNKAAERKGLFLFSLKNTTFHSLIREKIKEIMEVGTGEASKQSEAEMEWKRNTDCVSGRKAGADRAIKATTWQDVACGEQEKETGQI